MPKAVVVVVVVVLLAICVDDATAMVPVCVSVTACAAGGWAGGIKVALVKDHRWWAVTGLHNSSNRTAVVVRGKRIARVDSIEKRVPQVKQ